VAYTSSDTSSVAGGDPNDDDDEEEDPEEELDKEDPGEDPARILAVAVAILARRRCRLVGLTLIAFCKAKIRSQF